jgi:hypothetical protein
LTLSPQLLEKVVKLLAISKEVQYLQLLRSFCSSGHGIVYSRNQELIANIVDRHEKQVLETDQIDQMVCISYYFDLILVLIFFSILICRLKF